jgi:hypothetical protein
MPTEEKECSSIKLSIRVVERRHLGNDALPQHQLSRVEGHIGNRLFEPKVTPAPFAERYPRLTIFAVTAGIFLATITAEVECLRASGYYWRW